MLKIAIPFAILVTVSLWAGSPPLAFGQNVRQGEKQTREAHAPSKRDSTISAAADSTKHTLSAADTVTVLRDTLFRMASLGPVGSIDRSLDTTAVLTRDALHWIDYRYAGEILETLPGIFIRDQSSVGQYNQVTIRGVDWRSIAVMSNGRLLNDPSSGIYNLFHFSSEYADRIEVITGPRAFLYGLNSTGGAINFVTENYNSNKPFTKINYSESAYGYQYSDGTYSQNVSRRINLTFGFQFQSTDGRFPNSLDEAWIIRFKGRYSPSKNLHILLSEYMTSTNTDMNGGVDIAKSPAPLAFSPVQASVINTDSYEKLTRHDIDLSLIGTFLDDTVNVSTLTLYYSHSLREYRDDENRPYPNGLLVHADQVSSWMGAHLTQHLATRWQRASVGVNYEIRQIEGSPNLGRIRNALAAVWGKEEFLLGDALTVSGFARYDRYLSNNYLGAGVDARLTLAPPVTLFGGFSFSRRLPNYVEAYWSDSTVARPGPIQAERHSQAEAGAEFRLAESGNLRVAFFHRSIENPIVLTQYGSGFVFPGILFANGARTTSQGIEASLGIRLWFLSLEGNGMYILQRAEGNSLEDYPKLTGEGGIYFWNRIFNDNLDLKVGFRGRYLSSSRGALFNPEVLSYVRNTGTPIGRGGSVDFFLMAHIGDAYVHLMWENLTNATFFSTPYYPVLDRALRFGISWEFLN